MGDGCVEEGLDEDLGCSCDAFALKGGKFGGTKAVKKLLLIHR